MYALNVFHPLKKIKKRGFMLGNSSIHLHSMVLLHLEFPLSYVPLNQILRVNWFRTMCIPFINIHKLSETRSSVSEFVYILIILVGSFFRELGFHTSCLCIGLNVPLH